MLNNKRQDLESSFLTKVTEEDLLEAQETCESQLEQTSHLSALDSTKQIVSLSFYPILGQFLHPAYQLVNAAYVGRMGQIYLAGLGLGVMTCGILLQAIYTSFAQVAASLVAPAFGNNDVRLCRVILNRQLLLNTLVYAVIAVPVPFLRKLYAIIGQDPEVSEIAAKYVQWVCPGLYFYMQSQARSSYAQSMKYTQVRLISTLSGTFVHAMLIVMTERLGWGWEGVCVATSLNFVARDLGVATYVSTIEEYRQARDVQFFSRETCQNLSYQFKLGFMAMVMGVWGWWAFSIFTLIGTYLSVQVISAQTIMHSIGLLTYMIPLGIQVASGILIGQSLGKADKRAIKHYFNVSMGFAVIMGLIQMAALMTFRDTIIAIFTTESGVQAEMAKAWFLFAVFVFFDTTQGVAVSAIKASQLQKSGALITSLAYWLIGIPATLLLVFRFSCGIQGIWVGPTLAVVFLTLMYVLLFSHIDWQTLIKQTQQQRATDTQVPHDNPAIEEYSTSCDEQD